MALLLRRVEPDIYKKISVVVLKAKAHNFIWPRTDFQRVAQNRRQGFLPNTFSMNFGNLQMSEFAVKEEQIPSLAFPVQIPVHHSVPVPVSVSVPVPATEPEKTGKRSWSGAFGNTTEEVGEEQKRRAIPHDVLFRLMVPSRHIGRVIGKQGSRIQQIREDTRANIKIADTVNREEDRVIIINSTGNENEVSDAEKALLHIASVILKEEDVGVFITSFGLQHVTANMVRLLIAGSQAGCLIGKFGQNIENLRNLSGATISILAKDQFPMCASAHESDRVVQILGGIPEILKALEMVSRQIRENSPSKVISIRPTCNIGINYQNPMFLAQTPVDFINSEMTVPEALVGGLIGKGGYNITRIRNESGATIKVSGGRGEQNLRYIYFGGSSQQVALARKLIDDYIYSQSSQWQGS